MDTLFRMCKFFPSLGKLLNYSPGILYRANVPIQRKAAFAIEWQKGEEHRNRKAKEGKG
jgi:hypothetical protein